MSVFLNGLIWGLGLVTAGLLAAPLYYVLYHFFMRKMSEFGVGFLCEKKLTKAARLSITDFRSENTDEGLRILGQLQNAGKDIWGEIRIGVDLFDEDGEFVGQDYDVFDGVLEPGDKKHFSAEVECEKKPADVKVYVRKAEYVPSEQ